MLNPFLKMYNFWKKNDDDVITLTPYWEIFLMDTTELVAVVIFERKQLQNCMALRFLAITLEFTKKWFSTIQYDVKSKWTWCLSKKSVKRLCQDYTVKSFKKSVHFSSHFRMAAMGYLYSILSEGGDGVVGRRERSKENILNPPSPSPSVFPLEQKYTQT